MTTPTIRRVRLLHHERGQSVEFDLRLADAAGLLGRFRRRVSAAEVARWLQDQSEQRPTPPAVASSADDPSAPPRSLAEAAARWMREVVNVPGTYKPDEAYRKRMHWKAHLAPAFGELPLAGVTAPVVSRWIGDMADPEEPLSPSSIRNRVAVLSALLTWCVNMGWVPTNACATVKLPRVRRTEDHVHVLTPDEAGRAVGHFRAKGEPLDTMVPVLLLTGLRRGELVALHIEDADFERHLLHVRRAISGSTLGAPKGGGPRVLALSDLAEGYLAQQLARVGRRAGPFWPSPLSGRIYRGVDDVGSSIAEGLRALGISATAHDFRHTCATIMAAAGTRPDVIQRALGHESIQTTMRYVHAVRGDEALAEATRRVADVLRAALEDA